MGFKENLKSELEYAGISVKELAALSGVKQKTIESYLAPVPKTPSVKAAFSIAKVLKVSVEYLLTEKDEKNSRSVATLPDEIQKIVKVLERLSTQERKAVLALVEALKTGKP
jgi:transcriptional regulator with XRE-family HTH domain